MLTLASHLATVKTTRCGVIPYTVADGILHFLLARDKTSKDLGDFGGGAQKTEFALMAALREFGEESHGIFSHIYQSANDMSDKIAIIDGTKMAMIFAPLECKWIKDAQRIFADNPPTKKKSDEVSELVWVSEEEFINLIRTSSGMSGDVLWIKVGSFLRRFYDPFKMQCMLKAVANHKMDSSIRAR